MIWTYLWDPQYCPHPNYVNVIRQASLENWYNNHQYEHLWDPQCCRHHNYVDVIRQASLVNSPLTRGRRCIGLAFRFVSTILLSMFMIGDIYLWGVHSFKFSGHSSLQLLYFLFIHRGWSQILLFGETDLFWTVSVLTLIIICCQWYAIAIIKVAVIYLKLKFTNLKFTSKFCCMNYFDCNVTQSKVHLQVSAILAAVSFIWLEVENRFWSNPTHRCPST